jgi:uncharacterized protein (TIGR01244 family)
MLRIDDSFSVGGQPNESDITLLRRQGYRTVVNFREEDETSDQMPPTEEGDEVQTLGMKYVHLPTTSHTLTSDIFDRFRATITYLPRPIFAHCATGKRAAALVLAVLACQRQMAVEEIEESAATWGLRDRRDLIKTVQNYVFTHCAGQSQRK